MGGAPPPGRLGTAGAGLPVLGGGGGTLEPPVDPREPNVAIRNMRGRSERGQLHHMGSVTKATREREGQTCNRGTKGECTAWL